MDHLSKQNLFNVEKIRGVMTVVGDLLHYGHGNAACQAKKLCNELYVGVHTDIACKENKKSTVMEETERYKLFGAIRCVDSIIEGIQWNMTCKNLDEYECHLGLHGDDLSLNADNVDSYYEVRKANRFKEFKRTKNISTTDIVQRILDKNNGEPLFHSTDTSLIDYYLDLLRFKKSEIFVEAIGTSLTCYSYDFRDNIVNIANGKCANGDAVERKHVYTSGAFDIFNECHLELLKEASNTGSYLIVNVISDEEVYRISNGSRTILNLSERVLMLMHIKYVSMVIVGTLSKFDKELANHFQAEFYPGEYQEDVQGEKFKVKNAKIINKTILIHQ